MSARGFTLVELLVVIAIIGILASITLFALGGASAKGSDAGIQGNLNTIRRQAELYLTNNNLYSYDTGTTNTTGQADANGCGTTGLWTDPTIKQAVVNASAQAGVGTLKGISAVSVCKSTSTYWFIAVVKKSNNLKTWCVDSVGKAKESNASSFTNLAMGSMSSCP